MNKRAFVKNTAVMTMTSLLLRSLGIVFRIFISNRVGAEGMGLYQLVLSVYVLGGTFASAGLVTAVTRLVAEQLIRGNRRAARWVMRASMALCIAIGLASAVLLYRPSGSAAWRCRLSVLQAAYGGILRRGGGRVLPALRRSLSSLPASAAFCGCSG